MQNRADYLAFGTPNFTDAEIEAVTRIMRSGRMGMQAAQQLQAHDILDDELNWLGNEVIKPVADQKNRQHRSENLALFSKAS